MEPQNDSLLTVNNCNENTDELVYFFVLIFFKFALTFKHHLSVSFSHLLLTKGILSVEFEDTNRHLLSTNILVG